MNLSTATCVAALLLPIIVGTGEDTPSFAPEEGSTLTVTFEQKSNGELVENELSFLVNGEESEGLEQEELEISRSFTESISFTDEIIAIDDGTPTHVSRTFDEISMSSTEETINSEGDDFESENEQKSSLEGVTVEFVWDEDDEGYSKSSEDEDVEDVMLDRLELTGHLVELLPDDDASEGDEWKVDAAVFGKLVYPGGSLSYYYVDEDGDELGEQDEDEIARKDDWDEQYGENFEGDISLVHNGTREEDGVTLLVIGIEIDVETSVEQEEEISFEIDDEPGDGTITKTYSFAMELEGELLWNPELGHAVSLTFAGDNELEYEEAQDMPGDSVHLEITTVQLFEGTAEYSYTFE